MEQCSFDNAEHYLAANNGRSYWRTWSIAIASQ